MLSRSRLILRSKVINSVVLPPSRDCEAQREVSYNLPLTSNMLQIRFHVGSPVTAVGSPVIEVGVRNLLLSYVVPDIWRNFYIKSVLCRMYSTYANILKKCIAA